MVRQQRDFEALNYPELRPGLRLPSPASVPVVGGPARMPDWLTGEGRAFWERHAPECQRRGTLDSLTQTLFAVMASTWATLRQLDAEVEQRPDVPGLAESRDELEQQFQEMAAEFGLSLDVD